VLSRTYRFGVLRVIDGEDLAIAELQRQNDLWNDLVAMEAAHRKATRAEMYRDDPELHVLDRQIHEAKGIMAREHDAQAVLAAKQSLARMLPEAAARRDAWMRANRARLNAQQYEHRRVLQARAREHPLWWCHREAVLQAFETARWAAMRSGDYLWPKRFDGSGTLRSRLGSGGRQLCARDIVEGRTALIAIRPATHQELPSTVQARKADGSTRALVSMIVCEDGGDARRSVDLLVTLHRPVPPDAAVKEARLTRCSVAGSARRADWYLDLVVERRVSVQAQTTHVSPWVVSVEPPPFAEGEQTGPLVVARARREDVAGDVQAGDVQAGEATLTAVLTEHWIEAVRKTVTARQRQRSATAEAVRKAMHLCAGAVPGTETSMASLKELLEGSVPSLRDLQAAVAHVTGDGAADIRELVATATAAAEDAHRFAAKAARIRAHAYRNFAALLVEARRPVRLMVASNVGDGIAGSSVAAGELVRAVSEACAREGLPFERVDGDEKSAQGARRKSSRSVRRPASLQERIGYIDSARPAAKEAGT
jgi:hypothetical protein